MTGPSCVFCAIARGEQPRVAVYEDEVALAFMDIRPVNVGHVLVVPRRHETDLFRLPEDEYRHVMDLARRVACSLEEIYRPPRVGLVVSGFEVPHVHIHVFPLRGPRDIVASAHLDGTLVRVPHENLRPDGERIRRALDPGGAER